MHVEIYDADGGVVRTVPMRRDESGVFAATDTEGRAGSRYKFRMDGSDAFPDPASQAQSGSVHGASIVVDHSAYQWRDAAWQRPSYRDVVIYELHIGTFTESGTFRAAIERLPHLRALGVNAIEIMPIGDFPGSRGWGYDGVLIYAPASTYGSPDDFRALVDAAHEHGLAVILDVVYNHFGPDGNYLSAYSSAYFNEAHHTPWGAAFNFDGPFSEIVRGFFGRNPIYWMEHFHIDGFRFDATHAIVDTSEPHILTEMISEIHARGGYAIAEDSRNDIEVLESEKRGGQNFDGVWADDFHHIIRVGQTANREGYFQEFEGTLSELVATLRDGWYYHGQELLSGEKRRGSEGAHLPPSKFVHCISNHDQTGNRAFGDRLSENLSPEAYRAASVLICLTPYTPMLFMGQEWAATSPFLYFTAHNPELGALVTEGRRREFADFAEFGEHADLIKIPDPQAPETFEKSKLRWSEVGQAPHAELLRLHSAAIGLRMSDQAFRPEGREGWSVAQLSFGVGAIRFDGKESKYLLLFDLSGGHEGRLANEEIARGEKWELVIASNDQQFGGDGMISFDPATQTCRFGSAEAILLRAAS
jgi:maltooligosyltrehalose trehalohydrolase